MATRRWQDGANLLLGVWLFASPWLLGTLVTHAEVERYAGSAAAWNAYVLGAGLVAFAALAAYMPKAWQEAVNTLLGVWLVFSPFVLEFQGMPRMALHTVLIGILATAFAIWAMFNDREFYKRWHGVASTWRLAVQRFRHSG
jgi:SPW repeat